MRRYTTCSAVPIALNTLLCLSGRCSKSDDPLMHICTFFFHSVYSSIVQIGRLLEITEIQASQLCMISVSKAARWTHIKPCHSTICRPFRVLLGRGTSSRVALTGDLGCTVGESLRDDSKDNATSDSTASSSPNCFDLRYRCLSFSVEKHGLKERLRKIGSNRRAVASCIGLLSTLSPETSFFLLLVGCLSKMCSIH